MSGQKQVATFDDAISIYEELKTVLRKADGERCEYVSAEFSDRTVAEKLGVSIFSVQNIRRVRFGRLIDARGEQEAKLETRLRQVAGEILDRALAEMATVRRELGELRIKHDTLQNKHDLLCTMLSANRVVDVKHLRIGDPLKQNPQGPRLNG